MGTPRQQRVAAVILLSTLGMCALFLAQGATNLMGAALIDRAPVVGGDEHERLTTPGADAVATNRRVDVDHDKVKLMLQGPPPPVVEEDAGVPEEAIAGPSDCVDHPCDVPACVGQAVLTAAIVTASQAHSLVAITLNGASRLYRVGSTVDGKTIEYIDRHHVFMISGTQRCYMAMFEPETSGAPGAAAPAVAEATPTPTATPATTAESGDGISNEDMESGITRQSDRNFTVQRSFLEEVMRNQEEIMRTARVIPHEENGRVVGVKMYGIRRNSVLGRLGIQNGDMVRTMNGFDLTSPDTALEAYTRLSGADSLSLSVVRRGQPLTIDYSVQ